MDDDASFCHKRGLVDNSVIPTLRREGGGGCG